MSRCWNAPPRRVLRCGVSVAEQSCWVRRRKFFRSRGTFLPAPHYLQTLTSLAARDAGAPFALLRRCSNQLRFWAVLASVKFQQSNHGGGTTRGRHDEAQHVGRARRVYICWRNPARGLLSFSWGVRSGNARLKRAGLAEGLPGKSCSARDVVRASEVVRAPKTSPRAAASAGGRHGKHRSGYPPVFLFLALMQLSALYLAANHFRAGYHFSGNMNVERSDGCTHVCITQGRGG